MLKVVATVLVSAALAATAVVTAPVLLWSWSDSFCLIADHPRAADREGTIWSSRLSAWPPGLSCVYRPPRHVPIVVTHASWDRAVVRILLALLMVVAMATIALVGGLRRDAPSTGSGPGGR